MLFLIRNEISVDPFIALLQRAGKTQKKLAILEKMLEKSHYIFLKISESEEKLAKSFTNLNLHFDFNSCFTKIFGNKPLNG